VSGTAVQAGVIHQLRVYGNKADPLAVAAQRLATWVQRQWTEEAGFRSLLRPEPLRVRWSTTDRPVAAALESVWGEVIAADHPIRSRLHGDPRRLVEVFRALPVRRLVILGEPGAGKTVLALLFVLALLDEPAPNEPVPVILTASSWNPQEEHLHGWLARRLVEEYPGLSDKRTYGPETAMRLVTEGRIIPIIDGLDETPGRLHVAALDALDRGMVGTHPVVVTCRTAEYAAAVEEGGTGLSRAAVVEIDPVDLVDVAGFLCAAGPSAPRRWQPVLDRLSAQPDRPLARVLASPLMVALARTVYTDPKNDPIELLDADRFGDQAAIERHLLDSFVSAAYVQQPEVPARTWSSSTRTRYQPKQAQQWLRFLAQHLDRLGSRDLAWWELVRAVRPSTRGLLAGLTSGIVAVPAGYVADGSAIAVAYILGYVLWFGLAPGVVYLRAHEPRPSHVELIFHATAKQFFGRLRKRNEITFTL
jgi:hypothetical protein